MPSVSAKQAKLMSAIDHGWKPPASMRHAPSLAVAQEFHEADKAEGKYMHALGGLVNKYADGGPVGQQTQDILMTRLPPPAPNPTERFLGLVRHAADRATAVVTNDPSHALSRVAAGLASQIAGKNPQGRVEFGRLPNLVDEARSLPAAGADLATAGTNVLGALSDKLAPHAPGGTIPGTLSNLRDAWNSLLAKHGGDVTPGFARKAEASADSMHQATDSAMGLTAPHGFGENASESLGMMLGQLPIPAGEAKTAATGARGALAALVHSVPEYLGPTIRPGAVNYLSGALGGGALGALADSGQSTPPPLIPNTGGNLERFQ